MSFDYTASRPMKVLLAVPKFVSGPGQSYDFPLGIAYISAAMKVAGHDVHCLNLNNHTEEPADVVTEYIRAINPDVFGSGSLSPHFNRVETILKAAKAAKPDIVNLVGGGVVSADPLTSLAMLGADIGVIGEGEITVLEILDAIAEGRDISAIGGIVFNDPDGKPVQTPDRKAIKDLDSFPWPDYEGFAAEKVISAGAPTDNYFFQTNENPRSIPMIASRSCPYACTFCFHPTGRVYRERSLDSFFEELDAVIEKYGVNMIAILDEIFAVRKQRLLDFCERIKPYNLKWMVQLHVTTIDGKVLDAMKDAGCTYISYGLESVNNDILLSMRKKATRDQIETALKLTYEKKIGIQGNFIFGDQAETLETASDTMDWWTRHRHYHINLSQVQIYPGSPLCQKAIGKGLVASTEELILNPYLNVTSMADGTYMGLVRRLTVAQKSILNTAKILSFEKQEEEHPLRGDLYRVEWECPRCGNHNNFHDIPLNHNLHFQSFYLTCWDCLTRFDIENLARKYWFHDEAEELYKQATAFRDDGNLNSAVDKYLAIMAIPFHQQVNNRPDAVIRAAFDLGNIFINIDGFEKWAVYYFEEAVMRRAYNPNFHAAYALALLAEGSTGMARLHLRQAKMIGENADESDMDLDRIGKMIDAAGQGASRPRYFN